MDENLIIKLKEKAEALYQQEDFLCSEAVLWVINDYLGQPLPLESVRLASGFPVGIGGAGCTCGALTGAIMSLGLKYGRTGPGQNNEMIMALSKEIHNEFKEQFKNTCCRILTRDFEFGSPGHLEHCVHVTGAATAMALKRL